MEKAEQHQWPDPSRRCQYPKPDENPLPGYDDASLLDVVEPFVECRHGGKDENDEQHQLQQRQHATLAWIARGAIRPAPRRLCPFSRAASEGIPASRRSRALSV